MKFPLVEDKPNSMSGLVAEAIHVLLDEMSSFMITAGYEQAIIVQVYAATLNCFKGMTGEADTNKSMSPISKDPTVKSFEGTFKLPMSFVNETYDKVVTASSGKTLKRPPTVRHLELTYDKPSKTTVQDARKIIQNFRSRTIKNQPRPMYLIVYDQWGKPTATIPLGGGSFKNELLNTIYPKGRGKRGSTRPEYTPTVKFDNDVEMKTTNVKGIPKSIYVGDEHFTPYGTLSDDMAIYINEKDEKQEWVVKFTDGRCVSFSDFPSIEELKEGNYPVPTYYIDWTILDKEDIPESSDAAEAVDEQGNEVIEPSETEVNPTTDLTPDDEKNEQLEEGEDNTPDGNEAQSKTSTVKKGYEDENGYWVGAGGAASGILPICTTTGRICLAWRNAEMNGGDCWGTIGGGIQKGKSPAESARHEMMEEVGYKGGIRLIPAFVFTDGSFRYFNFLGLVPTEFGLNPMPGGSANLDFADETDEIKWFSLEDLKYEVEEHPGHFHPGLLALFENSGAIIRQIIDAVSNKG
jgi:8-oxo-dGTP pyrophosphatase MutT (NUDIX family)